jgi:hypothetical protein
MLFYEKLPKMIFFKSGNPDRKARAFAASRCLHTAFLTPSAQMKDARSILLNNPTIISF